MSLGTSENILLVIFITILLSRYLFIIRVNRDILTDFHVYLVFIIFFFDITELLVHMVLTHFQVYLLSVDISL